MTSPNFSNYIDLTVYDIDAYQAYQDAIAYARDAVPEFQPRSGTLEEAIMQAIAYNTAVISTQINRLPDGLMEGMARLAGLERREATFATGEAQFEVFDDNGVTIPLGTVISYETFFDDIVTTYPFETIADLVIPEGETTGTVQISALDAGVYPTLLGGQVLELVSPAPGVVAVELASSIFVGTDAETDSDYFNRASRHFLSLSSALVTSSQMENYIRVTYPYVGAVKVFDLTSPIDLAWGATPYPGGVTVVTSDIAGFPLSSEQLSFIENDVLDKTVAGLNVSVGSVDQVGINVDVDVVIADGYEPVPTRTAVSDYLKNKLSALGYDFSGMIVKNELISSVANIEGVRYVRSLALAAPGVGASVNTDGDIVLEYKNGVPDVESLGVLNVTSS